MKYCIITFFYDDIYYVKKTYCGRIIYAQSRGNAKWFTLDKAKNYLRKLQLQFPDVDLHLRSVQ